MLPIYVINLEDSTDRMKALTDHLHSQHLKCIRVDAVDGRKALPNAFPEYCSVRACRRHGMHLTGGEIACYLSHVRALKVFRNSGAPHAVILEDDATLSPEFTTSIQGVLEALARIKCWDVVNLSKSRNSLQRTVASFDGNELRNAFYFPMLATANLWSRDGAISFLRSKFGEHVSGPFDTELRSFCARRGNGFSLMLPIATQSGAPSDIDSAYERGQNNLRTSKTLSKRFSRHFPDHIAASFFQTRSLIRSAIRLFL